MNVLEMLQQSAVLSILGMAVVFAFLTIMVIVIDLIGKFISKRELGIQENIPLEKSKTISPEIVAVISTAISEYKKSNEKE